MNITQNFTAFYTLFLQEVLRIFRIWSQTLLPSAITMVLYFVIFGQLLGRQITPIDGFTYIQYIAPGLIMMAVITNAYTNVVGSFFIARFNKSIEELLISPMPNSLILLGYIAAGMVRSILTGVLVTVIALFFTHLRAEHIGVIAAIIILSASLFSLAGFTNGLYAKKFDDTFFIPTFILTPLTYLGGVFYSINILPEIWRNISLLNPILYLVNTFRYGILGISDVNIAFSFFMIIAANVALFFFNLHLMKKGKNLRT